MKQIVLTACCLMTGMMATAQVSLSFNPDKGAKYRYHYELQQNFTQSIMDQEISFNQNMSTVYDMNIINKTDTEIQTEFIYEEVHFEMTGGMMSMKYDSNHAPGDTSQIDSSVSKLFDCLTGSHFNALIATDGTVKSVSGMEVILDKMLNVLDGEVHELTPLKAAMTQQFNNEAIRKNFEQSTKIYPDKPVKIGDSWSIEQTIEILGMSLKTVSTYELISNTQETAIANIQSIITESHGKLSGNQSGTVEFDLRTGMAKNANLKQHIKGSIVANGMDIPLDVTSDIKTTTATIQ